MNSATFILTINFSIGLLFAVCFLSLTWRSRMQFAHWCAVGFVSASAAVCIEALAVGTPLVRLASGFSFVAFMLALTLIDIGLRKHYRPAVALYDLIGFCVSCIALNVVLIFYLQPESWIQTFVYQMPFAIALSMGGVTILKAKARRPADLVLIVVLFTCSLQFALKAFILSLAETGSISDYTTSVHAFYAAGAVLSILLGLSLVGVIVTNVMEESHARLQQDALSGLLNRSAFVDRVTAILKRPASTALTLIICDLDHFKSVNDRFGHAAGDAVIRGFGESLRFRFAQPALIGRLGGEEFCILIPDCDAECARSHVEGLRLLMMQNRYALIPADVSVTASFGIALLESHEPFDKALHRADTALYQAKAAGRDCYRFACAAEAQRALNDKRPFRL